MPETIDEYVNELARVYLGAQTNGELWVGHRCGLLALADHVRSATLERAAQIADEHASCEGIAQEIAARIRALKEKSDG